MVGLIILAIVWFISGCFGAVFLAAYEICVLDDWDINYFRLTLILTPLINTLYVIYLIYKLHTLNY